MLRKLSSVRRCPNKPAKANFPRPRFRGLGCAAQGESELPFSIRLYRRSRAPNQTRRRIRSKRGRAQPEDVESLRQICRCASTQFLFEVPLWIATKFLEPLALTTPGRETAASALGHSRTGHSPTEMLRIGARATAAIKLVRASQTLISNCLGLPQS